MVNLNCELHANNLIKAYQTIIKKAERKQQFVMRTCNICVDL